MWTAVFASQDKNKIDSLICALEQNGIMNRVHVSHEDDFGGEKAFEVLVPPTEIETAQDIIFDSGVMTKK
jgi:hypothetical protein